MRLIRSITADELAYLFHNIGLRLAPEFGFKAKDDGEFDPHSDEGKFVRAICAEVLNDLSNIGS
jgi:hypothetical protein